MVWFGVRENPLDHQLYQIFQIVLDNCTILTISGSFGPFHILKTSIL